MSAGPTPAQQQEMAHYNQALIEAAVQDGGGLFRFHAIPAAAFDAWIEAANQGDAQAIMVANLGNALGDRILSEDPAWPVVCGLCGVQPLRGTWFLLGLAVPLRDDPTAGLSMGICPSCCQTHPDPVGLVMTAFAPCLNGLRAIIVHPEGGRA